MGRLINTTAITLDGVADVSEWFVAEGDHDAAARAQFEGSAGMVMGRPNYEGLKGFWTAQTGEWADLLNPLPKFVASRNPTGSLEWNSRFIEGDPAEGVARLKDELEGDLFLIGCGELAEYMVMNGVVDELRFWIHPAIWGEGNRPFGGDKLRMKALESKTFDSGVTLIRFAPQVA